MLKALNIERIMSVCEKKVKVTRNNSLKNRKKLRILLINNFQCVSCGSRDELTIDHIYSVARIVKDREAKGLKVRIQKTKFNAEYLKNCKVLCVKCHEEKNRIVTQALKDFYGKKDFPEQEVKK